MGFLGSFPAECHSRAKGSQVPGKTTEIKIALLLELCSAHLTSHDCRPQVMRLLGNTGQTRRRGKRTYSLPETEGKKKAEAGIKTYTQPLHTPKRDEICYFTAPRPYRPSHSEYIGKANPNLGGRFCLRFPILREAKKVFSDRDSLTHQGKNQ